MLHQTVIFWSRLWIVYQGRISVCLKKIYFELIFSGSSKWEVWDLLLYVLNIWIYKALYLYVYVCVCVCYVLIVPPQYVCPPLPLNILSPLKMVVPSSRCLSPLFNLFVRMNYTGRGQSELLRKRDTYNIGHVRPWSSSFINKPWY